MLYMERTQEEQFLVKKPSSHSVFNSTSTHFWFKILEGPDSGKKLSIPAHPELYSNSDLSETISELTGGEIVEGVLERDDSTDNWKPIELTILHSSL